MSWHNLFVQLRNTRFVGTLRNQPPTQVVIGTAGLSMVLFVSLVGSIVAMTQSHNHLWHMRDQTSRLQYLMGEILHFDEVLTMPAKMHAATGETQWRERYHTNEPLLGKAIDEAETISALFDRPSHEEHLISHANKQLVELEVQSFQLVKQGQNAAALQLLDSTAYKQWQLEYRQGIQHRLHATQQQIQMATVNSQKFFQIAVGTSIGSFLILLPTWIYALRLLRQYIRQLQIVQTELANGNNNLQSTLAELQSTQVQLLQAEKMSGLGQLSAGIAHEINNPISFIHGNIKHINRYSYDLLTLFTAYDQAMPEGNPEINQIKQAIELEFLTIDLPQLLQSIETGTIRIRDIVQSLRNFSRLDEAELKTVNFYEGIDSTLMILRHRLMDNQQEIQVVKQYSELPLITCYPGLLNQVFMNLLVNAIDAVAGNPVDRPPQITIQTAIVDQRLRVGITDNGMGIDITHQASLFNPFFTTKPVGKGTGLGLSISYKIITEQHQGKIWVESTVNQGSTFWVEIPQLSAP